MNELRRSPGFSLSHWLAGIIYKIITKKLATNDNVMIPFAALNTSLRKGLAIGPPVTMAESP